MPSPASRASSAVISTGKPCVSCSSKTSPAWRFDSPLSRALRDEIVEQARAGRERLREALLLGLEQAADIVAMRRELRVAIGQRLDHGLVDGAQERRLDAEPRAVQHGAADEPPQHVAASLVGRGHAVGRDRRHAAPVIAEHAERAQRIAAVGVALAREALDRRDDMCRLIGLVDARCVLQQHRDALEAAARVDVLGRQGRQGAVVAAVELHEDEVPELEEAVAVAAGLAVGSAAAVLRTAVVVELRARAARARSGRPSRSCPRRARRCARRGCPAPARGRARRRRARAGRRPRRPSPRCAPDRVRTAPVESS